MVFEVNLHPYRLWNNLAACIPFLGFTSQMGVFPLRKKLEVAAIVNVPFLVILTRVLKIETVQKNSLFQRWQICSKYCHSTTFSLMADLAK